MRTVNNGVCLMFFSINYNYYCLLLIQCVFISLQIMLRISSVLSDDLSFTTIQDAISHVIASIRTQPDLSSPHQYCLSLIDELLLLMEPRGVVGGRVLGVHALADIIRLVCTAKKQLKMHKQGTPVYRTPVSQSVPMGYVVMLLVIIVT